MAKMYLRNHDGVIKVTGRSDAGFAYKKHMPVALIGGVLQPATNFATHAAFWPNFAGLIDEDRPLGHSSDPVVVICQAFGLFLDYPSPAAFNLFTRFQFAVDGGTGNLNGFSVVQGAAPGLFVTKVQKSMDQRDKVWLGFRSPLAV